MEPANKRHRPNDDDSSDESSEEAENSAEEASEESSNEDEVAMPVHALVPVNALTPLPLVSCFTPCQGRMGFSCRKCNEWVKRISDFGLLHALKRHPVEMRSSILCQLSQRNRDPRAESSETTRKRTSFARKLAVEIKRFTARDAAQVVDEHASPSSSNPHPSPSSSFRSSSTTTTTSSTGASASRSLEVRGVQSPSSSSGATTFQWSKARVQSPLSSSGTVAPQSLVRLAQELFAAGSRSQNPLVNSGPALAANANAPSPATSEPPKALITRTIYTKLPSLSSS